MRVFELAKKIGIPTKDLMTHLKKMGVKTNNHMSALEESDVETAMKKLGRPDGKSPFKPTPKSPKGAAKAAKISKAQAAAPVVEKKSRVLIKKKPTPEELAAAALLSPKIEEQTELLSPEQSQSAPEEVAAPTLEAPIEVAEAIGLEPADLLQKETPAPLTQAAPPASAVVTPPKSETVEKKVEKEKEKKKGKVETKKEPVKFGKEKAKKEKKVRWDVIAEEPAEAEVAEVETIEVGGAAPETGAAAPLDTVAPVEAVEAPVETRKWQDFKPIHRKNDRKSARRSSSAVIDITKPRRKVVKLHEGLTLKEFSELIGQRATVIISKLMEMGKMATINQTIDLDEAALIAEMFNVKTELVSDATEEDILRSAPDEPESLLPRPPVITIMGHVDHGKTSLLDAIRTTKVMEGEAGGITQHIGAYMVTVGSKKVTFLDTPGHEAFTAMRARGAKVTDIVVLVVAADDGVMPQTVEAINHAKAANVPIIVAINKIDKPEANLDRVKTALSEYELIPEAWGGKTIFAEVSAKKKLGLDHLLEMILLQAEVLELKVNPNKAMSGTIVEAKIDKGRGPVATVLVQEGTLRIGDAFVTGVHFGKVRALINDEGKKVMEAAPSTPVEVIGLDGVPLAGDTFVVVADERVAKEVANNRNQRQRLVELSQQRRVTLEDLYQEIKEGVVKELNIVIKADVQGSSEAIKESLEKLSTAAVKLRVIHRGVGGITESDVLLASASNAIVIGFNIRPEPKAQELAEKEHVDIRMYTIIYNAIADVKAAMEGLLDPTLKERVLGRVEVRQVFMIPKQGAIAGGYVSEGLIARNAAGARVLRDNVVVYEGKIGSLRRFKDDVKEVQTGYECGVGIENFNDIKVGDIIEAYTFDKIAGKL